MQLGVPAPGAFRRTDVLIIGSGAAGVAAARELAHAGVKVTLATREHPKDCSTTWAQGGLAAVWDRDDSLAAHERDTLLAGAGAGDPAAVRELVTEAPRAIARLISLGMPFDRDPDGSYDLHLEGGHSARRILHAGGDASGRVLHTTLFDPMWQQLGLLQSVRAIDVLTDAAGRACGVRFARGSEIFDISARAIVLATGGVGQAWSLTSNPQVTTGDGLAMAARAGARLRDMEFVQFHPTVLAVPRVGGRDVLISEAVRGEGARLVDAHATPLLPPGGELAPRDVVAAAIAEHLHSTGAPHAFLDARHLDFAARFPTITKLLTERGIDPATQLIPVRPGAHYLCGGIEADLSGRTSVPGLYAIGEVARTGVHGANRLASNSLPEALIAGWRCGQLLAQELPPTPGQVVKRPTVALTDPRALPELRQIMDTHVGVLRDAAGLQLGVDKLQHLPQLTDVMTKEALDISQLREAALHIATAALARKESLGCHRRTDYPTASQRSNHAA